VRDDDDPELKRLFAEAHRALDPEPPAFAATLASARRRTPRPAPARDALRAAGGLAALVALLAVALDLGRPAEPDPTDALHLAAQLDAWRGPTDFLGRLPGAELLGAPALPGPDPASDLPR
jgi:hypothetical protein